MSESLKRVLHAYLFLFILACFVSTVLGNAQYHINGQVLLEVAVTRMRIVIAVSHGGQEGVEMAVALSLNVKGKRTWAWLPSTSCLIRFSQVVCKAMQGFKMIPLLKVTLFEVQILSCTNLSPGYTSIRSAGNLFSYHDSRENLFLK